MEEVITELSTILDDARRRRRRIASWAAAGMGAIGMLLGLVWVARLLLAPTYEFKLQAVRDLQEVRALVKLGDEIELVRSWQAQYAAQSRQVAGCLMQKPNATSFGQCMRASPAAAFGIINKALAELDRHCDSRIPPGWRELPPDELEREILAALEQAMQADIHERVALLLENEASRLVLRRWGIDDYPDASRPGRRDLWIEALETAIADDIAPTAAWYESILSTEAINFRGSQDWGLVLRPRRDEIEFRGDQSTAGFEVWIERASSPNVPPSTDVELPKCETSDSTPQRGTSEEDRPKATRPTQWVAVDTGIRLIDCRLVAGPQGDVTIRWPASDGVIDHKVFDNFVRFIGIPRAFEIVGTRLRFDSQAELPAMEIEFEFRHEDLQACRAQDRLRLDATRATVFTHDDAIVRSATESLPRHLAGLTEYRGLKVDISDQATGRSHSGTLRVHDAFDLALSVSFDTDYRLCFSLTPDTRELHQVATYLCAQSESLAGMAGYCTVAGMTLSGNPAVLQGTATFAVQGRPVTPWSIDSGGRLSIVAPRTVLDQVSELRVELRAHGGSQLEADELHRAVERSIADQGALTAVVNIGQVTCSDVGNCFTLGLHIGDWPAVPLGPFSVTTLAEVDGLVRTALSERAVLDAVNAAWKTKSLHPRFGRSTAELMTWSPNEGLGIVRTTMLLGGGAYTLAVEERVRVTQGRLVVEVLEPVERSEPADISWVESTEASLMQRLKPDIDDFCKVVSASLSQAIGIVINLKLDDANPGRPWLRLCPPTATFQVSVLVPLLADTELGFGHIDIGQHGVSIPKAVIVQPRFSVPCGYFTASDPRCEVDFERHALALGLKLTPPFPGAGVPQADRTAATLQAFNVTGVPLPEVRWDNLFLHAGHLYAQVDGRFDRVSEEDSGRFVLGGQGDLILLEDNLLAQGRGELAVRDWKLERLTIRMDGELRPSDTHLGGVHGQFSLFPHHSDQGYMRLDGRVNINGFDLVGGLNFRTRFQRAFVDIDAETRLPVVGKARIEGTSDLSFREYGLRAGGRVPVPIAGCAIRYELSANPQSTHLEWWWDTPDGRTIRYVTEAPRIDLIDPVALQEEITSLVELSLLQGYFEPIDASNDLLTGAGASASESLASDGSTGEGGLGDPGQFAPPPYQSVPGMEDDPGHPEISLAVEGEVVRVLLNAPPFGELGRVSFRELGFEDWSGLDVWTGWTPGDQLSLFFVREASSSRAGHITSVLFETDGTTRIPAIEPTSEELAFARDQEAFQPGNEQPRRLLARAVVVDAMALRLFGYQDVSVESLAVPADSFFVGGESAQLERVATTYAPGSDGQVHRLTYVIEETTDLTAAIAAFAAGVPGLTADTESNTIVVAISREGGAVHGAFVRRESRDRFELLTLTTQGMVEHKLERIDDVPIRDIFELAAGIARSIWDRQDRLAGEVYVGRAGACLIQADGWQLLPARDLAATPLDTCIRLGKAEFDRGWGSTATGGGSEARIASESLLPPVLRSSAGRQRSSVREIGRAAVQDWERLKQETNPQRRWHAHPMGLLVELAILGEEGDRSPDVD